MSEGSPQSSSLGDVEEVEAENMTLVETVTSEGLLDQIGVATVNDPLTDTFVVSYSYFMELEQFLQGLKTRLADADAENSALKVGKYVNMAKKWFKYNSYLLDRKS